MIWKYLGNAQLQELITEELLERLDSILPVITQGEIDDTDIYALESLAQICASFFGAPFIRKKENRRLLLNAVPEDKLNELCVDLDVPTKLSFEEKVKKVVSLGWKDPEECRIFLLWAGLPESFVPRETTRILHEELLLPEMPPYKVLKDYQFDVYKDARKELAPPRARLVVQMPTGSGKTRTAMELITDLIRSSGPECVVVWVAHSEELCEQSVQCFKEIWSHVADRPLRLYRSWGGLGGLPYAFDGTAFIVASFQTLHSILKKSDVPFRELRERIALIIVDEAHKVIAPTYKKATGALIGNSTRIVGLTATPGRGEDAIEENKELAEFFFKKVLTINPPDDESVISYLRKRKVLSRMNIDPLMSGQTYSLTKRELTYLEKSFDYPPGFLSRIAGDDIRNLEIIKRLDRECKSDAQILFFACSVDHSKFISSLLQYLGHKSVHIDGETDKDFRRESLADFREGKIQVMCNYGVLSTGFDAPKTDVVFISRPTASIVLYSQMIGRGLRGPAIGGTEYCKLVDVKDNIVGFPDNDYIYSYFADYWEE